MNYGRITMSMGICMKADATDAKDIYAKADSALYASKKTAAIARHCLPRAFRRSAEHAPTFRRLRLATSDLIGELGSKQLQRGPVGELAIALRLTCRRVCARAAAPSSA